MSDAIEVEATPIETELAVITQAESWLAQTAEAVTDVCAKYEPPAVIADDDEFKAAKECRAACNNAYKKFDGERKAMLKEVEDRIKAFKAEVKDVLSPLSDLDARYKAVITEYEFAWREQRKAELADEYAKLAPDLVAHVDVDTGEIQDALVPFDRVLERYGNEKGMVWLNRTGWTVVMASLQNAVYDIREGEKAIDALVDSEDVEAVKALYFLTLDQDRAIAEGKRLREQRERVRQLEAERMLREAERKQERQMRPTAQDAPEHQMYAVAQDAHAWVISIPSATKPEMERVAQFMRDNGIRFDRIYAGTVTDAFRKENFGG